MISFRNLIQICKQSGTRETAVAGEDGMRALTADGQTGPLDMSYANLQYSFFRTVINGQSALDRRDLDVTHDPIAFDVQERFISVTLFIIQYILVVTVQDSGVEVFCVLPYHPVLLCIQVVHLMRVRDDGA